MYADYEFYVQSYYGEAIDEDSFPKYELRAREELDYYTFDRIQYVTDEGTMKKVKMCECRLMDLFNTYDEEIQRIKNYQAKQVEGNGLISSETVGKQSVSYQKATLRDIATVENELKSKTVEMIIKNLGMTGLLYRGVVSCLR